MSYDELFDAWERAWSGRDKRAFKPLCDPDVHYEDPLTPEPLEGHKAIAAHAQRLWAAFPDARLNVKNELVSGDWVVQEFTFEGTHDGTLSGPAGEIPATNRRLNGRGVQIFRVEDDAEATVVELADRPAQVRNPSARRVAVVPRVQHGLAQLLDRDRR